MAMQILQMVTDPVAARTRLDELEAALNNANAVVASADSIKTEQAATNKQLADREAHASDLLTALLRREHDVSQRENDCTAREAEIKRKMTALQAAIGDELK
jgi:hypothetical protein